MLLHAGFDIQEIIQLLKHVKIDKKWREHKTSSIKEGKNVENIPTLSFKNSWKMFYSKVVERK